MAEPRNYRIAGEFQTIEDSAGADKAISSNDAVRGRVAIQVAFADHDSAAAMIVGLAALSKEGTINVRTEALGTDAELNLRITLCRNTNVIMDAQHADAGSHVATFVGRTSDGDSFGISEP